MKLDFPAKRKGTTSEEFQPGEHDPFEAVVQRVSRAAGPIALLLGYLLIYVAYRFIF